MKNKDLTTASQSQNKPLNETHPTLWALWNKLDGDTPEIMQMQLDLHTKDIQSCTIDIKEHKDVLSDYGKCVALVTQAEAEVERLHKELEHAKANSTGVHANYWLKEGIAEGERRANEKIKSLLTLRIKRSVCIDTPEDAIRVKAKIVYAKELMEELGLGEVQQ